MEKDNKVTLKSADGELFQMDASIASQLEIVKLIIEDLGTDIVIPVPEISGKTLAKIVEYCGYHVEKQIQDIFQDNHPSELTELPAIDDELSWQFGEFFKENEFGLRHFFASLYTRKGHDRALIGNQTNDQPSAEGNAGFVRGEFNSCVNRYARPIQKQIEDAVNQRLHGSESFVQYFFSNLEKRMNSLIEDVVNLESLGWWIRNDSRRDKWRSQSYEYFMQIFKGYLQRCVLEEIQEEVRRRDAKFVDVDRVLLFDLIWAAHFFNIKSLLDLLGGTSFETLTPEESAGIRNFINTGLR